MKMKILAALTLLIVAGSAMAYATGWNVDGVAVQAAGNLESSESYFVSSQIEMLFLFLLGAVGLGLARKHSVA